MRGGMGSWTRLTCAVGLAVSLLALTFVARWSGAPAAAAPLPPPRLIVGRTELVSRVSGIVTVRLAHAAKFVALTGSETVPDGSEVDANDGRVEVAVSTGPTTATSSAQVYGSRFVIHQGPHIPATTHFILSQPLGCAVGGGSKPEPKSTREASVARAPAKTPAKGRGRRASASQKQAARNLYVSDGGGNYETDGRYAVAIGVGTAWLTADSCTESFVKVSEGVVRVKDLITGQTATLNAGQQFVAAKPERAPYLPGSGVYFGVTGQSALAFTRQVGRRQAVFGAFATWGSGIVGYIKQAQALHARLLLHISTSVGYGQPEVITPGAIAQGAGDAYLLTIGRELAQAGHPAYIALLPEMNQTNNDYSAFNADGSRRDAAHSASAYRQAWRRSVLILRGGSVASIDAALGHLHLPPVQMPAAVSQPTRAATTTTATASSLPAAPLAFLWAPQTAGTPDVAGNAPAAYYPGSAYVDIVGTDFYSQFPNFAGLTRFYAAYPTKPFAFNEWGMWVKGNPSFVTQFFAFLRTHPRVHLAVYNQGLNPDGPFRLKRFPAATRAIRHQLKISGAIDYTPDWAPAP
jgi:hypothetical protein